MKINASILCTLFLCSFINGQLKAQEETIHVKKDTGLHPSNLDITIGGRIVRDEDTISLSLVLKAGGIGINDTVKEDYFITSFEFSLPIADLDVTLLSKTGSFTEGEMNLLGQAVNRTELYIGNVYYWTGKGKFVINKKIYLRLVKYIPPTPPDTTKKWESKFDVTVAGHSKGTISKKELQEAEKIDISGPYDSSFITSFDVTFEYLRANAFETTRLNSSDFAHSASNKFTKEMFALIKKAPDNTAITISNINYSIGKKKLTFKKTLNLLIQ